MWGVHSTLNLICQSTWTAHLQCDVNHVSSQSIKVHFEFVKQHSNLLIFTFDLDIYLTTEDNLYLVFVQGELKGISKTVWHKTKQSSRGDTDRRLNWFLADLVFLQSIALKCCALYTTICHNATNRQTHLLCCIHCKSDIDYERFIRWPREPSTMQLEKVQANIKTHTSNSVLQQNRSVSQGHWKVMNLAGTFEVMCIQYAGMFVTVHALFFI